MGTLRAIITKWALLGLQRERMRMHNLGVRLPRWRRGRALVPIPDEGTPPIVRLQGPGVILSDFRGSGTITARIINGRPKGDGSFAIRQLRRVTAYPWRSNSGVRHAGTEAAGGGGRWGRSQGHCRRQIGCGGRRWRNRRRLGNGWGHGWRRGGTVTYSQVGKGQDQL